MVCNNGCIHNQKSDRYIDVGQYFPNFRETISNSDLNASQYLYINTTWVTNSNLYK